METVVKPLAGYPGWYSQYIPEHGYYSLPEGGYCEFITPKGRIADYPGGPLRGQLSKEDFAALKRRANTPNNTKEQDMPLHSVTISKRSFVKETGNGYRVVVNLVKIA